MLYVLDNAGGSIRTIDINTVQVKSITKDNTSTFTRGRKYSDGPGTTAMIFFAKGMALIGTTLYVSDGTHRIRTVQIGTTAATTVVGTLAGNGTTGTADGAVADARFNSPSGIAASGNTLYIADQNNHRIRALAIASGTVSTIAGSTKGYKDGVGTAAQFDKPFDIAVSPDGNTLYITDQDNHRIRALAIASGTVSTIAGSTKGYKDGAGAAAQFSSPMGIAVSPDGKTLYVADYDNHRIRAVTIASGAVSTIAGSTKGYDDGIGTAAQFAEPLGITASGANTIYVTTYGDYCIRKLEYK